MSFDVESYLEERKEVVNRYLRECFPPGRVETRLRESIVYSLHSDGKRLRPILCLAASELVCGSYEKALPAACAIEMIHTYSLVHDDLPSMDDDDTRRGKPSNHRVFGEAVATLAGDALLTDAFGVMASGCLSAGVEPRVVAGVISVVAEAAGSGGMVAGQSLDLETRGADEPSAELLTRVNLLKTARIFTASVVSGAMIGGAGKRELSSLESYSKKVGLAFQIRDDVLDSDEEPGGNGPSERKSAAAPVVNREESEAMVADLTSRAVSELRGFRKRPNALEEIAVWLGERRR